MTVDFSPSQIMALRDLIAEHLARPGHTDVYVDAGRGVETTAAELLVTLTLAEAMTRSREIAAGVREALAIDSDDLDVNGFYATRQLPDRRWLAVEPQTFGRARLCLIGPGPDLVDALTIHFGYEDTWDYATKDAALQVLQTWTGDGDPGGWRRHPATARRRQPDGSIEVRETDLGGTAIDATAIATLRQAVAAGAAHECTEWWGERSGRCVLCDRPRVDR